MRAAEGHDAGDGQILICLRLGDSDGDGVNIPEGERLGARGKISMGGHYANPSIT